MSSPTLMRTRRRAVARPAQRLSPHDFWAIRRSILSVSFLCATYGVAPRTILDIKTGRLWS